MRGTRALERAAERVRCLRTQLTDAMHDVLVRQGVAETRFARCPVRHIKSKGVMQTWLDKARTRVSPFASARAASTGCMRARAQVGNWEAALAAWTEEAATAGGVGAATASAAG